MAKIKVRRTHREELPGVSIVRDSVAGGLASLPPATGKLDLDMEIDPNLVHLITHDPDGFMTALDRDETVGFAAAQVRSRQCILCELWVLSQHQGKGAGEALLSKVIAYGERSGARGYMAVVPVEASAQALLLKHGFEPITPVYHFSLDREASRRLGPALSRLLPGEDVSREVLEFRGQPDLERIERVTRNLTREVDQMYWLKTRNLNVAFIRQGTRVAAYAFGGAGQAGPAGGSSQDAALAAVGWSIDMAAKADPSGRIDLYVPAAFKPAVESLLEGGARLTTTFVLMGRGVTTTFDRCIFGAPGLP
jgi:GNAT superfamily N-acetyltransferase